MPWKIFIASCFLLCLRVCVVVITSSYEYRVVLERRFITDVHIPVLAAPPWMAFRRPCHRASLSEQLIVYKPCKAAGPVTVCCYHVTRQQMNQTFKIASPHQSSVTTCTPSAAISPLKTSTVATQTQTKLHARMIPDIYECSLRGCPQASKQAFTCMCAI